MELLLWVYKYLWIVVSGILFIIWTYKAFKDIIGYLKSDRSVDGIFALKPSTIAWIMIVFCIFTLGSFSYWFINNDTISRILSEM
jgi:hypothetical protein